MTHTITSTKQLAAIFPDLPRTNKFKRSLDILLANTPHARVTIDVCDAWRCFKLTDGRKFKARFSFGGKSHFLARTRVRNSNFSRSEIDANPGKYKDVKNSESTFCVDGVNWLPTAFASFEDTDGFGWSQLALVFGKLLKSEITVIEDCHKCGGSGFLPHYAHIANGVCFSCCGVGKFIQLTDEAKKALNKTK
jgi:hypothetical protein